MFIDKCSKLINVLFLLVAIWINIIVLGVSIKQYTLLFIVVVFGLFVCYLILKRKENPIFSNSFFKNNQDYIFVSAKGEKIKEVSNQFQRIVDSIGLNKGITDTRNKVVFHTLRHTFASWLAMAGVDIYTIKELMGHSDIKMTQRYMHLAPNKFTSAVAVLDAELPAIELSVQK